MLRISTIFALLLLFHLPDLCAQTSFYDPGEIKQTMKKATDWQLNNLHTETPLSDGGTEPVPETGWIRGVFYTGLMATYQATEDKKYLDQATNWAENNNWEFGERKKHADDQVVGQTYADLYALDRDPKRIREMQKIYDEMIASPVPGLIVGWSKNKNWKWCDALYMAPPAMAHLSRLTGKPEYMYLMNTMWWECYLHLYDEQDSLFYRDDRYVWEEGKENLTSKNGKKIFWGRGNGWVMAGLAQLLPHIPDDYSTRTAYENVFKEMSYRIAGLQSDDGLWRASLLDEDDFPSPETSGTAFYTYALAWGVNEDLLPADHFVPVIKRAWEGLNKYMSPNGKLGFVQQVGHDPRKVTMDDSMEYGTAGYLLTANEMLELIKNQDI